ncbi:MAG: dihydropteroate synthase [Firmicutes bacterium]|nr:dihydropteroate synthase [Bacillota bacterium]
MELKFCQYVLALSRVSLRGALIIKQEMLSLGGEAALPREAAALAAEQVDVLLSGTAKQLLGLAEKLARQPFGLKQVAKELQEAVEPLLAPRSGHWQCREYSLPLGQKTYIMGILNVTPDSFSDGGRYLEPEAAIRRARQMVDEGADIIDVGGESTRPGAEFVSEEDELARVIPVVSQLAKELAVPISVDTTKYRVAEASLEAGASIINDISGLQFEPRLADLAAKYRAGLVLMHTRGTPREMQKNPVYTDVVAEVLSFLQSAVDQALARGVSREQIILDPGIGFAKTCEHNLEILNRLAEFRTLGYPLLLGTSRKSFIGKVLDLPVDQRVEGTAASVALGIAAGADVVRVHDVREMARVAKVSDAIARYQRSGQDES